VIAALSHLLVAACVVEGTLLSMDGVPVPQVEVVRATSGEVLVHTAIDGSFRVETPDEEGIVLEFRHEDWLTVVRRFSCGQPGVEARISPRVYSLDPFRVSAGRLEATYGSSAVREEDVYETVSPEDAEGGGATLAQAVQQLPGIGAVGRDGLTSSPTIRGMGRDRTLMLLEGVRLSSDRGVGPSGSFLDPFLVDGATIVRGAAGVAYGSGAIGGVIATELGGAGETPAGALRVAGNTNGSGRLYAGRASGFGRGAWRVGAGGFFRTTDDYEFPADGDLPGGDAVNSGFDSYGGRLTAERDWHGGQLRISGLATSAEDIGRPLTRDNRLDTIEVEEHELVAVRFARGEERRRLEWAGGVHIPRTINRTERFDDAGVRTRTGRTTNDSVDGTLSFLSERPRRGRGTWLVGADLFTRSNVDAVETNVYDPGSPGETSSTVQLLSNGRRVDVGTFLATKTPVRHLGEAIAAVRLDWVKRAVDGEDSFSKFAPSLHVGIVHPMSERWALSGSFGRAFRAPRLQELYFAGDRPGGTRLANPGLLPEVAWTGEGGMRWATDTFSFDGTAWGMRADDLIVQLPVDAAGDTLRNVNESEGRLYGAEAMFRWRHADGRAQASVAYAYTHGENKHGEPLPDIPTGELRVAGDWAVWGRPDVRAVTLRAAVRAGGAKTPLPDGLDEKWWSGALGATDIGGDEVPHPGYARWDAGARLRVDPRVTFDVSVTNLLDARYTDRPESDAYPQPGRSVRVELTLTS
jgi:hemoglobin/transferrin/lactoferrin receptor protein